MLRSLSSTIRGGLWRGEWSMKPSPSPQRVLGLVGKMRGEYIETKLAYRIAAVRTR